MTSVETKLFRKKKQKNKKGGLLNHAVDDAAVIGQVRTSHTCDPCARRICGASVALSPQHQKKHVNAAPAFVRPASSHTKMGQQEGWSRFSRSHILPLIRLTGARDVVYTGSFLSAGVAYFFPKDTTPSNG
jgi:hypothetical protein